MPPLPNLKCRELLRVFLLLDFVFVRQTGSHIILKKTTNGRIAVLPFHKGKDLSTGTLRAILRESGISVGELLELLEE